MKNWIVDPKEKGLVLEPSGTLMAAGRHHVRRRAGKPSACGGCYARALSALQAIRDTPSEGGRIARDVLSAVRAEGTP